VARFGGLAALGVGVLLSTGLLLGREQVQSWGGLLLTDYGRTLVIKLVLAAAALGLGAYNSLTAPHASAADLSARTPLWIAAEAALAMAAIFAAAAMTDLPTAAAAGTAGAAVAGETQVPLALTATSQGWRLDLRATPGRIGSNVFELALTPPSGELAALAPANLDAATLQFTSPGGGSAAMLALGASRPGLFTGTGGALNHAGAWQVRATVQPAAGAPAISASYDLAVGLDGTVRATDAPLPWTVQVVGWLNDHGRGLLAVVLVLFAGAWTWIASRSRRGLARLGWVVAGALAAVALVTTVVFIN
jgi:hypothetical protein